VSIGGKLIDASRRGGRLSCLLFYAVGLRTLEGPPTDRPRC